MRSAAFKYLLIPAACAALVFSFAAAANASASPEPTNKTIKKEIKIGQKIAKAVEEQMPRVVDPKLEQKLAVIASRLIPYMQRELNYEVRIVKMDAPNAFSLPGGYTYMTTKMLEILESDDEIAAVLAHEFVHADRSHALVQAARNSKLNLVTLAGIIAAAQGAGPGAAIMAGAMQTAMINAYSIDLEKEADARGILALYRSGYNPTAMLTLMERLRAEALKNRAYASLGIYQTHPEEEERIEAAVKFMNDNNIPIQRKRITGALAVEVNEAYGKLYLNIDGENMISLPYSAENDSFLRNFKTSLDNYLELELAPYDFYVTDIDGRKAMSIRGNIILYSDDLPAGAPSLREIRDRINERLIKTRRHLPLTDFFQ